MEEIEEEREEVLLGSAGGAPRVRVRATGECGQRAVQEELRLLAVLEVSGLSAVPAVLEIEDDGYTRESAPALQRRTGRHAADDGAAPTAERLALQRAREDLDALIDALHERGWVLGARPGAGLGVRADGSVVVRDLEGLRREEGLLVRQQDRLWIDSVLQDQERTLRRRMHRTGSGNAWGRAELAFSAPPAADEPPCDDAPTTERIPNSPSPETPLPAPRGSAKPRRTAPPSGAARSALRGLRAPVEEVLAHARLRRIAAMSAVAVLVLGGGTAAGAWWLVRDAEVSPAQGSTPPAAEPEQSAAAPVIEDPWELAAELAGARHAYVTGVSETPVAMPGSAALAEDRQTRQAYRGYQVRGGGPVVHDAELLEPPDGAGTAALRAVTSTAEHQLEDPHGRITDVAASEPIEVRLALRWDGTRWLIETAAQEGSEPQASGD